MVAMLSRYVYHCAAGFDVPPALVHHIMARILTDQEIADLLGEKKPLPPNWGTRLRLRQKRGYQYEERQLDVTSEQGRNFRFVARRNRQNPLDFSIILVFEDDDGNDYRLTRYNGKHPSRHTNRWEKDMGEASHTFDPDFHIHRATERYQRDGYAIDGYAETTDDYSDYGSAFDAFLEGCNFEQVDSAQQKLL